MAEQSLTEMAPRVSVVVPVYCASEAHREFLRLTLESAAAQTQRAFEVVLVDDASPMDISPVIGAVENLPEVRVVRHESNLGHARSRNDGIASARADLIAFLDHDDLWLPEKLEAQAAELDNRPDAAAVFCDVDIMGEHCPGLYVDPTVVPREPSLLWMVTHNNAVITASAVMARKAALEEIGGFDSRYTSCDDFDAWIRMRWRAPLLHLPRTLARYRLHAANANYAVDRRIDNRLLTALLFDVWRGMPPQGKLAMMPTLARKLAGRLVYAIAERRSIEG